MQTYTPDIYGGLQMSKIDYSPIINYVKMCIKDEIPASVAHVAARFNVHGDTVRRALRQAGLLNKFITMKKPVHISVEESKQRSQVRCLRQEKNEAIKKVQELEAQLNLHLTLDKVAKEILPHKIEIRKAKGKKEATAFTLAGDWHYEEEVRPESINGLNEFNLKIAKTRTDRYFERTLKLLNMCRKESYIKKMVAVALGDFITGWIHDDLISPTTPPEALLLVFEAWLSGLKFWLDNADLDELIFVGICGNHGRITKKKHYRSVAEKNYEWLIYNFLCKWAAVEFTGKTKIKFLLPAGYFNRFSVYGRKIRAHHGDGIRYQGGIGGVHIPLRKAIAQWNKASWADLDILAHWHTRMIAKDYVVNGSLIGYNEFAQAIKADFERPNQGFFILHPEYDKTAEFSIVL